jgi:hypothetical protein
MARIRPPRSGRTASGPPGVLQFMNRTLTVFRGTEVDDAGDESDVGIIFLQGVPAALAEESHETFDPASSTRRTVRTVTCIVQPWAGIDSNDTLLDEFTGYFYAIESLEARPGPGYYPPQTILTLRQVTGVSPASGPEPAED